MLRRALAKLPLEKREVLVLSRFQNLKYGEIAEILDCEIGAVKVRVYRATRELSQIFYELSGREGIMKCDDSKRTTAGLLDAARWMKPRSPQMQAHLAGCSACRAEAETLGVIWKKLGAIPEERPGRGLAGAV